jgi:dTDP-3-amino-3,4,6-trideoxy-alpha-D-glucose transaminase
VVPVVDLTRRHRRLERSFLDATERVLLSGRVLLGPELDALESELDTALHVDAIPARNVVVGVSSGASALQLTFAALGIGAGDEVIIPAFTAVPTASAVAAVGACPVPVDVDPLTAAIDVHACRAAITARTRAIVVVHLYGRPVDVRPFVATGLPVVEDAAQAHGALRDVTGIAAAYSFYPTKNLGGIGDGGAVVTADRDLATRVRRLRSHGMAENYVHVDVSQNHRMSELEAAWLRLLMPLLREDNARRASISERYRTSAPHLRWHASHPEHVVHQCVVRVEGRDGVRATLASRGVATGVHYPLAITQQPAYKDATRQPCPLAETWAAECVSLPCFPELTDEEVDSVVDALQAVAS